MLGFKRLKLPHGFPQWSWTYHKIGVYIPIFFRIPVIDCADDHSSKSDFYPIGTLDVMPYKAWETWQSCEMFPFLKKTGNCWIYPCPCMPWWGILKMQGRYHHYYKGGLREQKHRHKFQPRSDFLVAHLVFWRDDVPMMFLFPSDSIFNL